MTASAQEAVRRARSLRELQELPNVGPSIARDLYDLGIRAAGDLRRRNPERMYSRLCVLRGARIDPCVLYVFRAAVYVASTARPDPARVPWWRWKDPAPTSPRRRPAASRA